MSYCNTELIYFICKTFAEAETRAETLRRQGIPARIVKKKHYKAFEVRIPKKKEDLFRGFMKAERKNDIWRGPTKAELENTEELNA